jgi:hypothetical protein
LGRGVKLVGATSLSHRKNLPLVEIIMKAFFVREALIKVGMARAFFCSAYADMAEESDEANALAMSGRDWMDVLPEATDPAATHAAQTLTFGMERDNGTTIGQIYMAARKAWISADATKQGDRDLTPDMFGHYCAMQAMGHGVGLRDAFGEGVADITHVPYVEFGSHSLQRDYDFADDRRNAS